MQNKFVSIIKNRNIHPELLLYYEKLYKNNIKNIVFYGPAGSGKYYQVLKYLEFFSPSKLKYQKKITINFNSNQYTYKVSDIHIEIDMQLLGCQAKALWNTIYKFIFNMFFISKELFIVCKNFHTINDDLLSVFECYMQKNYYKEISLHFILITNHISFIHKTILNKLVTINIPSPNKTILKKCFNNKYHEYNSLIELKSDIVVVKYGDKLIHNLLEFINKGELDIEKLRELLYNCLTYNINIYYIVNNILNNLIENDYINKDNALTIYIITYNFLKFYNNNYRSIFHLESYIVNLIKELNE